MDIYPAYIALGLMAIILYRIFESINSENEYHLKHLFYHFVFQYIFIAHYSIHLITSYEFSITVTFLLRYFTYLFLYLYIKSVIYSKRAKLKIGYFALAGLILSVYYLNTKGIHLINYSSKVTSDSSIYHINASVISGNEDFLFLSYFGQLIYSILMLRLFFNSHKLTSNPENIIRLKDGLTLYLVFFIVSILLTMNNIVLLYFNIHFISYSFITRMIGFTTLLIFFIFPNTSKELFSIKLKKKTTNKTKSIFDQILNYFEESEPFLNPNYNLSNLSIDTGFRNEIIRESIKSHSNKTVPAFINSHRIEKACKLIQEGYLKQYSMNALVEVSGFTSQPTFNRAFKLVSGKTPTEYSESYS